MTNWSKVLDHLVAHEREPTAADPPFAGRLALPYPDSWERGRVISAWPVDQRFFNERGVIFGGFLAALCDHAMGTVTMSVLEADEAFATSDLRTSFFRPVTDGTLTIEAKVIHRSRKLVHTEVVLAAENESLVAKASATQVIIRS